MKKNNNHLRVVKPEKAEAVGDREEQFYDLENEMVGWWSNAWTVQEMGELSSIFFDPDKIKKD